MARAPAYPLSAVSAYAAVSALSTLSDARAKLWRPILPACVSSYADDCVSSATATRRGRSRSGLAACRRHPTSRCRHSAAGRRHPALTANGGCLAAVRRQRNQRRGIDRRRLDRRRRRRHADNRRRCHRGLIPLVRTVALHGSH